MQKEYANSKFFKPAWLSFANKNNVNSSSQPTLGRVFEKTVDRFVALHSFLISGVGRTTATRGLEAENPEKVQQGNATFCNGRILIGQRVRNLGF